MDREDLSKKVRKAIDELVADPEATLAITITGSPSEEAVQEMIAAWDKLFLELGRTLTMRIEYRGYES